MINPHIIQEVLTDQLSAIASYMHDPDINEIMVTADGVVWVESSGEIVDSGVVLSEGARQLALTAVATSVGRELKPNSEMAIVSASVGGMRFAGALHPIDERGTTLCIRKHLDPANRPSLEQLISWSMLSQAQSDLLLDLIIVKKRNAVFVGATSSGKTTLTNAILGKLPPHERIGIIEDAKELAPKSKNCDAMLTNEQHGITSRLLIQHALRSRYDRLIIGESRGMDTFDLIRAFNSGHNGSITTMHGNSAVDGLSTIEMLYQMSLPEGASISTDVSRKYIAASIHVLVFTERTRQAREDGSFRSVRKVQEIALVKGVDLNGNYEVEYL